ncbi:hypothetical protein Pfo_016459 [Paulownia fortunei]|nr:hypothetical protein Pfo_016459 [Paulownia fortunei]
MADEPFSTYFFSVTGTSATNEFSTNIFPRLNFNEIIFFIIPTLVNFLQLMYQSSDKNPFATHPNTMGIAVCASSICYLACSGQLTFSVGRFPAACVCRHCMVWSGNVSVASLASMFAPDSVRPLLYAVSILLSASELLHLLYKRVLDGRREFYNLRSGYFGRFISRLGPNYFTEPARILPL